jgi:hypothetical protein
MLDDTCYFIGFDNLEDAQIAQFLLNKPETQEFIESFMFFDAKRAITKDLLMRINLDKILRNTDFSALHCIANSDILNKYTSLHKKKEPLQTKLF